MKKNNNVPIFIGVIAVVILVVIICISAVVKNLARRVTDTDFIPSGGDLTVETMLDNINVSEATPVKASIELTNTTLYDELPDISKYPLAVEGNGDIDIEIFTSGEKAGKNTDAWLIDVAEEFNNSRVTTASGKSVSMSVRSVSSGLAADYIASGRYEPDLYTPSNTLFGEYCIVNGGQLELYNERTVGNTAGILVKKDSGYTSVDKVIDDVIAGKINLGYTNPQTSATGLNLLITILKDYGGDNMFSDDAINTFSTFNNNIPFVAYTTQQMRDSASNGSLDAMVSEYQAYINDQNLTSMYDFLPFGIRHDNPLYLVNPSGKSDEELEAVGLINDFMMNSESQKVATKYGFNANDGASSAYTTSGAEISQALDVYKKNKDSGKDIIAVFVADCSGSMDGAPIIALRDSLTNGMQYINDNNYVGLVSYSDDVTIELPIGQFDLTQKSYFQGAVNNLYANGATASYDAIVVAMDMIEKAKADHPDAKCMIFLLSDGAQNRGYSLSSITPALQESTIPVYTISYGDEGDADALAELSAVNEAAAISADSDDIMYKIKSLFNSSL